MHWPNTSRIGITSKSYRGFIRKRGIIDLIKDSKFEFTPASGSYFQLLSYRNISKENDVELAKRWTVEKGIASVPISVFYPKLTDNKVLRFCFAKENEVLEKAAEILCKI